MASRKDSPYSSKGDIMNLLYHCNDCDGREFIIVDDEEALVPKMYPPYCPYCGKKDVVEYIREL